MTTADSSKFLMAKAPKTAMVKQVNGHKPEPEGLIGLDGNEC